ncbi:MAG: N-acetyltransferase [Deltaproteobacteria bacterium]|nr:N-acetyltransferase [Deltaproteobacteria bacterium]
MTLEVRHESAEDEPAIRALNTSAFETDAEARLVDALRASGALTLSLVAVLDGRIVGHIAFSPVTVDADGRTVQGIGLAPMAVAPTHQRQGIGARLIEEGLRELRARGHSFCVVLGHVGYYPRHGFLPAPPRGLRWEKGHDEAFFVQPLAPGALDGVSGLVRYRPELDGL